ncbi:MAG: metallophosphoesterase [Deltaproteobacteria bacterium]|nr:metallophosphoesterase [Deltaproteobacteria bacterium]
MKLQILADLHTEFLMSGPLGQAQKILDDTFNTQADVTVIAGDHYNKGCSISKLPDLFPSGRQIVYVAGNHDYYGSVYQLALEKMRQEASSYSQIHFLENDLVEIDGIVFLGAAWWTDMRLFEASPYAGLYDFRKTLIDVAAGMNDYRKIQFLTDDGKLRPLQPADTIQIHHNSVQWLREQFEIYRGRKIVVVTHHAPSMRSIHESYYQNIMSAAYASNLDALVEASEATYWIHGHVHDQVDYKIGKTRVLSNCLGYSYEVAEAQGFRPDMVVEV